MYWDREADDDDYNNFCFDEDYDPDEEVPCDCRENKDVLNQEFDRKERFSIDMMKMLSDGIFNDVCIKLHDGEIKAIKSVLAARCEYFAATFRWKRNNNHDMDEIVVNGCSKKIMMRIIEYIFSGVLKFEMLSLLEFLELKDQVRKMFPGDTLEEDMEHFFLRTYDDFSIPKNEEIFQAMSLVETGNLQSQVIAELGKALANGSGSHREVKIRTSALASLAHYGVLEPVKKLVLRGYGIGSSDHSTPLDLGFVPGDHLKTLVPCVTDVMFITNVTNCDMASLLDSVYCKDLRLTQKLNQKETEALVRAMTSRVEIVYLGSSYWVTSLDVDTLTKYQGDGKCREVHCCVNRMQIDGGDRWIKFSEAVTWANKMNWNIKSGAMFSNEYISITRK